ncbi:hypothetical protein DOE76_03225 [Leifsonia sp. ku-ls]|nr:hypothetical protein DOE76_03225 [Leifsonia sp. ku-ls]
MGEIAAERPGNATGRVDFAGISALSSRPAGYAVAAKCLQVQAEAERADPSLASSARTTLHPDAWPWFQGALGEIEVGRLLDALGPEWFVRHSVPIGANTKDVDHLVVGPAGVFAINTKHHAGASVWVGDHVLRVNNANTSHLRAAIRDGHDVARRLAEKVGFPVPVRSVIAVLDARSLTDRRAPHDGAVAVVDARSLASWLRAQTTPLGSAHLDLVKLAAEEPGTWHVDRHAAETFRVMQRFERLVARVRSEPARSSRPGVSKTARTPRHEPQRRPSSSRGRGALRAWIEAAVIIGAVLVFRAFANQPCDPLAMCLAPPLYAAWKPLLIVLAVAVVVRAVILTARRRRR